MKSSHMLGIAAVGVVGVLGFLYMKNQGQGVGGLPGPNGMSAGPSVQYPYAINQGVRTDQGNVANQPWVSAVAKPSSGFLADVANSVGNISSIVKGGQELSSSLSDIFGWGDDSADSYFS